MTPLFRYTLLQIPGWLFLAALLWWAVTGGWIPVTTATMVMAAWMLKDAALYPLCRPAFVAAPINGAEALIGREAETVTSLAPQGWVRLGGERWSARSRDAVHLDANRRIRVVGLDGLILIVEPVA